MNFIFPPGFDFLDLTWKSRTPAITAGSGSLTTVTGAVSRHIVLGKLVIDNFQFTISNNGTGDTSVLVSTAFQIKEHTAGLARENSALGPVMMTGFAGANTIMLTRLDNGYPGGNGRLFFGTLVYEIN